jgi:hypothetical protein
MSATIETRAPGEIWTEMDHLRFLAAAKIIELNDLKRLNKRSWKYQLTIEVLKRRLPPEPAILVDVFRYRDFYTPCSGATIWEMKIRFLHLERLFAVHQEQGGFRERASKLMICGATCRLQLDGIVSNYGLPPYTPALMRAFLNGLFSYNVYYCREGAFGPNEFGPCYAIDPRRRPHNARKKCGPSCYLCSEMKRASSRYDETLPRISGRAFCICGCCRLMDEIFEAIENARLTQYMKQQLPPGYFTTISKFIAEAVGSKRKIHDVYKFTSPLKDKKFP